jgi:hypothetical protein
MHAAEARALLFQRKLAYQEFKGSVPGIPELDGQLGILELTGTVTSQIDMLAKGPDGKTIDTLQMAGIVANGLVLRETKERIFSDGDIEGVASMGTTVLLPITIAISELSGISKESLEIAKKNFSSQVDTDSPTSSLEK